MSRPRVLVLVLSLTLLASCTPESVTQSIDRHALVTRHNPEIRQADSLSPLSVGNGAFTFTAGITGLQTFPDYYQHGMSLATQSDWGWHSFPNPSDFRLEDTFRSYDTYGRQVEYASETNTPAGSWLRANPHRLDLGRIGFVLQHADGSPVQLSDITDIHQKLNLWTGLLTSRFQVDGEPVAVETSVHPDRDLVAVKVRSPLIKNGRLQVRFAFSYPTGNWGKPMDDWSRPDAHQTIETERTDHGISLRRVLDATEYRVRIRWAGQAGISKTAPHQYQLGANEQDQLEFVCRFSEQPSVNPLPTVPETETAAARHWQAFWTSGGAVDLTGSTDPRADELERRIVLSQYLTAIQSAGPLPPQETGLTFNSWFGKFHLEMHWWHEVQFILWGRPELFEKSFQWYKKILPMAQAKAKRQGYRGARWPKMVGPDGRESPSGVGVFLIWQEPHPIYYAELLYRAHPEKSTLETYQEIVFQTADFMAYYAHWDAENQRYVLGPPLIPAQEIHPARTTRNPTFELAYWAYGLKTAQRWRERLGLPRNKKWDDVLRHLSALPVRDSVYVNTETAPNTFQDPAQRRDHPTLLGALGMLPGDGVKPDIMRRTLQKVMKTWNWDQTWGWDYPLTAMTAARVGEPETAIDALLMPVTKNTYLPNGHNYQSGRLPLYLPGNGGLLTAVAMMAAGWDGAPKGNAPGFPHNGKWHVRWEGLSRMP